MRSVGVVTVGRSDYSIYEPILNKIESDPGLHLKLIVGGMHLSPEFGLTVEAIEADGFEVAERVEMLLSSDSPGGIARSMGLGTIGYSHAFELLQPDILMVLGDRFEMHAAALAALPFMIPVGHIHGGELTQGAIDDALRHSITKLSHLHFVTTETHKTRVIQMGEEPWRVIVSGAPSLDNLHTFEPLQAAELEDLNQIILDPSPLIVTFHPVTLDYENTAWHISELLAALEMSKLPVVFTMTNADTGGREIINQVRRFVEDHPSAWLIDNLGTRAYLSLMSLAAAMVGNSSSGIIEAASFSLPVVDIGTRQQGRFKPQNVINTGYDCADILEGIMEAVKPEFRKRIQGMTNPYSTGNASDTIVDTLKSVPLDDKLITKRFWDMSPAMPGG